MSIPSLLRNLIYSNMMCTFITQKNRFIIKRYSFKCICICKMINSTSIFITNQQIYLISGPLHFVQGLFIFVLLFTLWIS